MAIRFQVFPQLGLVYVHYSGVLRMDETLRVFADYTRHPEYRPGQKQLVNLSDLTGMDMDYVKLMQMQATKADHFHLPEWETLLAFYADTPENLRIAQIVIQSWTDVPGVAARAFGDEASALAFLGLPETRLETIRAGPTGIEARRFPGPD